jgi:hypothetical protein
MKITAAFLLACVAHRLQMNRFELHARKIISGRSCSGNSNVLRQLGRRPLWDAALHLIAVLDSSIADLRRVGPGA